MTLTSGKHMGVVSLVLFAASSIVTLIHPSTHSAAIALLSLLGYVGSSSLDLLKVEKPKDFTPEILVAESRILNLENALKALEPERKEIEKTSSEVERQSDLVKELESQLKKVKTQNDELEKQFGMIRDNISTASAAGILRRK